MWSSKMAARWRGDDGSLNAGRGGCPCGSQLLLCRGVEVDPPSCVDHSILAIFEDSAVTPEDKSAAEDESETLLSALTEILDCVEDDDGEALSPFDTLPNTKLLSRQERRDTLKAGASPPRRQAANVAIKICHGDEGEARRAVDDGHRTQEFSRKTAQMLFQPKCKSREGEVEVFTTASLVNLVKLMHPYCLQLQVEEGEGRGRKSAARTCAASRGIRTLFSKEEVWKYERPTGDSDEEIHVVSEDDEPRREAEGDADPDGEASGGKPLKSALANGRSPEAQLAREKKKVRFGAVHIASIDDRAGANAEESDTTAVEMALKTPAAPSADGTPETQGSLSKSEPRAKSLSLQQYRQLRQRRPPLVEKQGNYTTMWPTVPEPPKELTPILCLHGQTDDRQTAKVSHRQPNCAGTVPPRVHGPPEYPSDRAPLPAGYLRTVSKTASPASPLPEGPSCKKSPVKKPALLSSDPPNPVLLPLPVAVTTSTSPLSSGETKVNLLRKALSNDGRRCPEELPATSPSPEAQPKHDRLPGGNGTQDDESRFAEDACETFSGPPTPLSAERAHSENAKRPDAKLADLPKIPQSAGPDQVTSPPSPPDEHHGAAGSGVSSLKEPSVAGIEATDLTSLLEQFEEKQAEAGRGPEPRRPGGPAGRDGAADASTAPLVGHKPLTASDSAGDPSDVRGLDHANAGESPRAEVVLGARQSPRRRHPPPKAIQIIEPRRLPSRRGHAAGSRSSQPSPHALFSVSSDHDYCLPSDPSRTSAASHPPAEPSAHGGAAKRDAGVKSPGDSRANVPRNTEDFKGAVPPFPGDAATETDALPTPPPTPPSRGREKRAYRRRSPPSDSSPCSSSSSSSSSSSGSRSPKRRRLRCRRSEGSSWSSSPSPSASSCSPPRRFGLPRSRCSRSRSRSWSRSPSPLSPVCRSRWRDVCSSRESRKLRREREARIQKLKAIDERRVVYVGRIRRSMTHDELRERFSQFGEVECVSLHFRDKGDHYGFVTFYNMEDAFAAIDNGGKLRRPDELPFDICFGGRRQFCNSDYADLDASRGAESSPARGRFEELDFDSLLRQAQRSRDR